jgi:hypothetical protein
MQQTHLTFDIDKRPPTQRTSTLGNPRTSETSNFVAARKEKVRRKSPSPSTVRLSSSESGETESVPLAVIIGLASNDKETRSWAALQLIKRPIAYRSAEVMFILQPEWFGFDAAVEWSYSCTVKCRRFINILRRALD